MHSTRENEHFGASFMSVGGVKAEISMPQHTEKYRKKSTLGASMKLAPKCLFSQVLRNDIEYYLRGRGTEKI